MISIITNSVGHSPSNLQFYWTLFRLCVCCFYFQFEIDTHTRTPHAHINRRAYTAHIAVVRRVIFAIHLIAMVVIVIILAHNGLCVMFARGLQPYGIYHSIRHEIVKSFSVGMKLAWKKMVFAWAQNQYQKVPIEIRIDIFIFVDIVFSWLIRVEAFTQHLPYESHMRTVYLDLSKRAFCYILIKLSLTLVNGSDHAKKIEPKTSQIHPKAIHTLDWINIKKTI